MVIGGVGGALSFDCSVPRSQSNDEDPQNEALLRRTFMTERNVFMKEISLGKAENWPCLFSLHRQKVIQKILQALLVLQVLNKGFDRTRVPTKTGIRLRIYGSRRKICTFHYDPILWTKPKNRSDHSIPEGSGD